MLTTCANRSLTTPLTTDAVQPTDPSESRQFSQVITMLQHSYPRDKMAEIRNLFCFTSLVHLAIEQGSEAQDHICYCRPDKLPDGGQCW